MSLSKHKNRLIQITPNPGNPDTSDAYPSVARIQDGTDAVFWGPQQPIQTAEPPGYSPPPNWPQPYTLITPPRCCRMFVVGSGTLVQFMMTGTEPWLNGNTSAYCTTATPSNVPNTPGSITLSCSNGTGVIDKYFAGATFTLAQANAAQTALFPGGGTFTSVTPISVGSCGGGATSSPAVQTWYNAFPTIAAAIAPIDFYGQLIQPANYLTPISVAPQYVPIAGGNSPYPALFGRPCLIVVFVDDTAYNVYDPTTVAASTVGQRILGVLQNYPTQPAFPDIQILLVGNGVSSIFDTQLTGIASALAGGNVSYITSDPNSIVGNIQNFFSG